MVIMWHRNWNGFMASVWVEHTGLLPMWHYTAPQPHHLPIQYDVEKPRTKKIFLHKNLLCLTLNYVHTIRDVLSAFFSRRLFHKWFFFEFIVTYLMILLWCFLSHWPFIATSARQITVFCFFSFCFLFSCKSLAFQVFFSGQFSNGVAFVWHTRKNSIKT